jgi:RES domain-containing protein
MEYLKHCVICGAEFTTRMENKLYCSHSCALEVRRLKRRASVKPRRCVQCGTEFIPVRGNQRYCGRACAREAERERKAERARDRTGVLKHERTCAVCGARFVPKALNQLYCSKRCAAEAHRRRDRARRQRADLPSPPNPIRQQPQNKVWVEEIGMRLSPATAHLREVVLNLERSRVEKERRKAGVPAERS